MRKPRCRNRVSKIWRAFLLLTLVCSGPDRTNAAEDEVSFSGNYRDERMSVDLNPPTRTGQKTIYTGAIQLGDQKFPLKAEADEGHLKGTFESQGDAFEFTGTIVGHMLVLTTDGTTYRLKKQTTNPLARPNRPNPLTAARTNSVVLTNRAPSASLAPTNAPASAARLPTGHALHLMRYSVLDDILIGGEAFSCLLPLGWQVEGGLAWRLHPMVPACLDLRIVNPIRTEMLQIYPSIPFVWADDGIPLFPPGSNYMGNEVAEPVVDPAVYIKTVLVPRFRKELVQAKVIASEELPRIAEVIAKASEEPGVQKNFRAGRVRLEYTESGRVMHEDIYCVLVKAYAATIKTTFWGVDRNYSFKAEKGKLESESKLLQTILDSFQSTLPWFNRYVQLVQLLVQSQFNAIHRVGDLNAILARTTTEISDARRQSYDTQQTARARINEQVSRIVQGTKIYRNPIDAQTLELPAGYREAWVNAAGEVLLLDDANFNPNTAGSDTWQKMGALTP